MKKCCDCQATYIGKTGRNLGTRLIEHKRATRNSNVNNHIAEHHLLTKLQIGLDRTNDLLTESSKTNHERTTGQMTIWLTINDCLTVTVDGSKRTNDITILHSQYHHGLTERRPITSRLNWPVRSITRFECHQLTLYNSLWLWRWLRHRLSKRQFLSTATVLFRITFTRPIKLSLLMKWLLVSNHLPNLFIYLFRCKFRWWVAHAHASISSKCATGRNEFVVARIGCWLHVLRGRTGN